MRMTTLPEMLGESLFKWFTEEMSKGQLTKTRLRAKLEEHRAELEKREIDAGYAYYAIEYALGQTGRNLHE